VSENLDTDNLSLAPGAWYRSILYAFAAFGILTLMSYVINALELALTKAYTELNRLDLCVCGKPSDAEIEMRQRMNELTA
tara:strand:- start:414 stop:653 length:240 start_codon:yes stop_codon:yes gene_type:complete